MDGDSYVFMNNKTYDQINIQESMVDKKEFLQEAMIVNILFFMQMKKFL